jgi:hypothetical protein
MTPPEFLTDFLKVLAKPEEAHKNGKRVDEAQVGEDGDEVDVELLVRIQVFDIDTAEQRSKEIISSQLSHRSNPA